MLTGIMCLAALGLVGPTPGAHAATNRELSETVPFDHWAYDAVQKLVHEGIIIGFPKTHDFRGERRLTRYDLAMALSRLMDWHGVVSPAGPQGPPGPAGPAGLVGPPGPKPTDQEFRALLEPLLGQGLAPAAAAFTDLTERLDRLEKENQELRKRLRRLEGR